MKGSVLLVHADPDHRLRLAATIAARSIGVVPVASIADALFAATAARPAAAAIEPAQLTSERGTRLATRFAEAAGHAVRVVALTNKPTALETDAFRRHGATPLLHPLEDIRLADNLEVLVESTIGGAVVPEMTATEATKPSAATILVVDDSETIRTLVSKYLTSAGYRVITASHAANALRIVSSGVRIDAVVSDLMMPGMDGFELKHEIDRTRETSMPFVLITGEATAENRKIALELGSSDFVAKPIQADPLVRAIERLLTRS